MKDDAHQFFRIKSFDASTDDAQMNLSFQSDAPESVAFDIGVTLDRDLARKLRDKIDAWLAR